MNVNQYRAALKSDPSELSGLVLPLNTGSAIIGRKQNVTLSDSYTNTPASSTKSISIHRLIKLPMTSPSSCDGGGSTPASAGDCTFMFHQRAPVVVKSIAPANGEDVAENGNSTAKLSMVNATSKNSRRKSDKPRKRKRGNEDIHEVGNGDRSLNEPETNSETVRNSSTPVEQSNDCRSQTTAERNGGVETEMNFSTSTSSGYFDVRGADAPPPPPADRAICKNSSADCTNIVTKLHHNSLSPQDLTVRPPPPIHVVDNGQLPRSSSHLQQVVSSGNGEIVRVITTDIKKINRRDGTDPWTVPSAVGQVGGQPPPPSSLSSSSVQDLEAAMNRHLPTGSGDGDGGSESLSSSLRRGGGSTTHHRQPPPLHRSTIQWIGTATDVGGAAGGGRAARSANLPASTLLRSLYANRESVIRTNVYTVPSPPTGLGPTGNYYGCPSSLQDCCSAAAPPPDILLTPPDGTAVGRTNLESSLLAVAAGHQRRSTVSLAAVPVDGYYPSSSLTSDNFCSPSNMAANMTANMVIDASYTITPPSSVSPHGRQGAPPPHHRRYHRSSTNAFSGLPGSPSNLIVDSQPFSSLPDCNGGSLIIPIKPHSLYSLPGVYSSCQSFTSYDAMTYHAHYAANASDQPNAPYPPPPCFDFAATYGSLATTKAGVNAGLKGSELW